MSNEYEIIKNLEDLAENQLLIMKTLNKMSDILTNIAKNQGEFLDVTKTIAEKIK